MTNWSNDDIAKALHGLASGDHAEPQEGPGQSAHGVPVAPTPAPAPKPLLPPAAAGPVDTLNPGRVARPSTPESGTARPAGPPAVRATAIPVRAPGSPPPAAPPLQPASAPFVVGDGGEADADDAVLMPAPSVEYLAHHPHAPTQPRGLQAGSLSRSVRFRRTLIPILLTTGLLMVLTAVLKYSVNPDAPLAAMPVWMAILLAVSGVALVVVAGLNVVQLGR